jgi:hypothetical protein
MSSPNEKRVAALASLVPLTRDALRNVDLGEHMAELSPKAGRHKGDREMAHYFERFMQTHSDNGRFWRQLSAKLQPKQSNLPAITIALVGAGLIWALMASRKPKLAEQAEEGGVAAEQEARKAVGNLEVLANQV